jgi:hypothetical protein
MARYAEEIEKMIHVSFQGSIDNVSEETRHTILLYHQVSKILASIFQPPHKPDLL